jgi:FixJ family two-component response regulator
VANRALPAARVLFVTGYPNRQIVVELLGEGAVGILEKPFAAARSGPA